MARAVMTTNPENDEQQQVEAATPSKSARKRAALAAQQLGEKLIGLKDAELDALAVEKKRSGPPRGAGLASAARPGTENQAASPVSQSDTCTPLATAAAATVQAWLPRSGSSLTAVALITRVRATPEL